MTGAQLNMFWTSISFPNNNIVYNNLNIAKHVKQLNVFTLSKKHTRLHLNECNNYYAAL
mgnify:CR=1 FL=1